MSTIFDKRIAVRVTNTMESPYLFKEHTQMAEFTVVTPEQSKHIKPADMAILSMNSQGDPDLTAYLNEFLKTIKPEQQNKTFWFPIPEKPGRPGDDTPIETRSLRELTELQNKQKTQPTWQHRIPKEIFSTSCLDWHPRNRNRGASNWRYPGRLSRHFR